MVTFSESKDFPPELLIVLFNQTQWSQGRTVHDTLTMLAQSDLVISAWDSNRLIGFGRVLTDYVFRASIWDVIVDRQYQGRDIGTQVMRRILDHPSLKNVELFWLCTRDKQAFYATLGFSDREQTGMVWDRKKHGS
ncbi:MAG: GNAT family N-acetyltransferase [Nitrospirales bacterium]|nr:GNAT family N-acetyltransferase [Nitrospira sp.]MDR4500554.1 GNAT family N-acetyltransferase [Nitrospirales bacterium]